MSSAVRQSKSGTTEVRFGCLAPDAHGVCLVGAFNNWDPQASPMTRAENGEWTAVLALPPGTHEYKLLVDGCWCCQPGMEDSQYPGEDTVPNCFGTKNRVMKVE